MKNLLKKNQIIITALAIMIAIAGYLNLTKDNMAEEQNRIDGYVSQNGAYDQFSEADLLAENDLSQALLDISEEDNQPDTYGVTVSGSGELIQTGENPEEADSDPLQDTAAPGEAVLASTTISPDYFSSAKLTREQTRSRNKEMLMNLIADATITETQKQEAFDKIVALAETAEVENATELLLEAKGFEGAVVSIIDESVDVVVNAQSITDRQVAQIEDIVMRKTGVEAESIVILPVVAQD